jgi:ammonium transporter, Amt family
LFACGKFGATGATGADNSSPVAGLFYGGGTAVLKAQVIGSATITIATFVVAFVLMYIVKQMPHPWSLRVPAEAETGEGGLDAYEHGTGAYHEQELLPEGYELGENGEAPGYSPRPVPAFE